MYELQSTAVFDRDEMEVIVSSHWFSFGLCVFLDFIAGMSVLPQGSVLLCSGLKGATATLQSMSDIHIRVHYMNPRGGFV